MSGVILSTMHVQDLKDQEGDAARGRQTVPLALGNRVARWTLAVPICLWSCLCTQFWGVGATAVGLAVFALGALVAVRCVRCSGRSADRRTWEL